MKKVLIIEDEKELLFSIEEMLTYENYQVYTAQEGEQGLKMAREKHPDVILCDILMPKMNGFEVLKKLNTDALFLDVPFIFLTALTERNNQRDGMELGADDYLTKPFTREELLNSISSRLQKHEAREKYFEERLHNIHEKVSSKLQAIENELTEKNQSLSDILTEKELIGGKLKEMETELMSETFELIETNNTLSDLKDILNAELQNTDIPKDFRKVLMQLKRKASEKKILKNSWSVFQLKFNQVYPGFITNLTSIYKDLTQYELVFISAHLMGLSTNQLGDLLNITEDSVRKSRYRLKKKLGLKKEDNFLGFIHSFNNE